MNDLPLVTIAIPTYNRVEYLKQALASAMAQTYPNLEIIVSDNASSDETNSYMRTVFDRRVKYLQQSENLGMVGNWNICLKNASGEYFLLLSDDDLIDKDYLQTAMKVFAKSKTIAMVHANTRIRDTRRNREYFSLKSPDVESGEDLIKHFLLGKRNVILSTAVLCVERLNAIGGFPKDYKYAADAAAWIKVITNSQVGYVNAESGLYLIHESSVTNSIQLEKIIEEDWRIVELGKDLIKDKENDKKVLQGFNFFVLKHFLVMLKEVRFQRNSREIILRIIKSNTNLLKINFVYSIPRILAVLAFSRKPSS